MGLVFGASGVVGVVGGEQRGTNLFRDLHQVGHNPPLCFDAVVLDFDEEVVLAEDVLEPGGGGDGGVEVTDLALVGLLPGIWGKQLRYKAPEAARGGDNARSVLAEQVPIHPGLVLIALEVRPRAELEEIAVTGLVFGEEVHVESLVGVADRPIASVAVCEICLDPDDRLDPGCFGRLNEVDNSVHHTVIGDSNGGLPVPGCGFDYVTDTCGAIEHRIFGMKMEMGKRHDV